MFKILVSIPHNYPLIIGDRHKNFEDLMFFLKGPFHSFYIQSLITLFFETPCILLSYFDLKVFMVHPLYLMEEVKHSNCWYVKQLLIFAGNGIGLNQMLSTSRRNDFSHKQGWHESTNSPREISAHTDGGPRFHVCARETLYSAPHRHERKFSGTRFCRVKKKNLKNGRRPQKNENGRRPQQNKN